jgi:WD40 repeat protein
MNNENSKSNQKVNGQAKRKGLKVITNQLGVDKQIKQSSNNHRTETTCCLGKLDLIGCLSSAKKSKKILTLASVSNNSLLASYDNSTIKIWDTNTGDKIKKQTYDNDNNCLISLLDNNSLICGFSNGIIKLWDIDNLKKKPKIFSGHTDYVLCFTILSDKLFASASCDKTIKIWNKENSSNVFSLLGHKSGVKCLAVLKDGCSLASSSNDKTIQIWNLTSRSSISLVNKFQDVTCLVALNEDTLVIGKCNGGIKKINIQLNTIMHFDGGHDTPVKSLAVFPCGRLFASCAFEDSLIKIWDIIETKAIKKLTGHAAEVICLVVLTGSDLLLASASLDNKIIIWDVKNQTPIRFINW